ncbi:hypothetical protein WDU94_005824 [Cyamophila willieti]
MRSSSNKKKAVPKPHWREEHLKYLRQTGQPYEMRTAEPKIRKARRLQPPCTKTCRLRCYKKFTHDRRQAIFREFWDLGNIELQRIYIAKNLEQAQPKQYRPDRTNYESGRRGITATHLVNQNGTRERVCQLFFRNTLDVTQKMLRIIQKKMKSPEFTFEELRGKNKRKPATNYSTNDNVS